MYAHAECSRENTRGNYGTQAVGMQSGTGSRDLVVQPGAPRRAAEPDGAALNQWRSEYLAVPGTGHLKVALLPSDDSAGTQLARRVAADPGDDRLHVARVNHHVLAEEADAVYAALVDAFLAFAASGQGLRHRLLEGGRRLIGSQRAGFLDRHVATGLTPATPFPYCPGSMLSRGVTGSTDLVRVAVPGGPR